MADQAYNCLFECVDSIVEQILWQGILHMVAIKEYCEWVMQEKQKSSTCERI